MLFLDNCLRTSAVIRSWARALFCSNFYNVFQTAFGMINGRGNEICCSLFTIEFISCLGYDSFDLIHFHPPGTAQTTL